MARLIVAQKAGSYFLGVDTGGTYTDAVIVRPDSREVVAAAKALTTRGDLSIGVGEAMGRVIEAAGGAAAARDIALVSVSTTLATNAVVEGHGGAICVILAGFDEAMVERSGLTRAFPGLPLIAIAGGHDHGGDQKQPLDEEALRAALATHAPGVEAFAVAARFAVRNPAHEHRIRDIVTGATGKPVTLSSELSSDLDAPRRALTSALNARLISRISLLVNAVGTAMAGLSIKAPLMMVKGDGSLAQAQGVALRPIETVLSGPAASLVGAAALSGLDDLIMSDMGGTTTDLGILRAGRPLITDRGANVGGWRTMVKAVDVRTIGLGGDSAVEFAANGGIAVGPQRAVPAALIGQRFPKVIAQLEADLAEPEGASLAGRFAMRPLGAKADAEAPAGLKPREAELLARIGDEPVALRRLAGSTGALRTLAALERKGAIQVSGFTPSDAAHVLHLQDNWSYEAAWLMARLVCRHRDMNFPSDDRVEAMCREVHDEVVRLTGRVILETALGDDYPGGDSGAVLLDAVCGNAARVGLASIAVRPTVPVIAVGGPVRVYYGEVGDRLGADMRFPENCDVANAIGAAVGVIARAVTVEISGDGSGLFRVFAPDGVQTVRGAPAALAVAEQAARHAARDAVTEMGGEAPEFHVDIARQYLPDATGDSGLFAAQITVEAVARPAVTIR